jgi:hypothetical protein
MKVQRHIAEELNAQNLLGTLYGNFKDTLKGHLK